MSTHMQCGSLFDSRTAQVAPDQVIVIDDGRVCWVGPTREAPPRGERDAVIDYSGQFVMPGLIDNHVHLSYGESRTEEDIDLFSSVEFRALRGMEAAQRVLKAGFTSITDPTTTGRVSLAIRDAVHAGLYVGPRISCSGTNISTRQGLIDWYPTWIGVPSTSIGRVVRNIAEGIDAIREQVKDGVDIIKLAMDGDAMNPSSVRLAAAFNQTEVDALVGEAHRLGRQVVVHARGSEGVLYAARAKVDVIFHASYMDAEALAAVVQNGCAICPTLSLLVNTIEFTEPTDGCYSSLVPAHRKELAAARVNLQAAREAGVPFMVGSEAGFAVTPYGEWHARELENHVEYLGFTPAAVLQQATLGNSRFHRDGATIGVLEEGRWADILVLNRNPITDIACLQDPGSIHAIHLGGELVDRTANLKRRRLASENSYSMWGASYTRERIARRRSM